MTFWVAGAVVAGGVIGAVGSSVAAGQQAGAQRQAANTQAQMFGSIQGLEQPFVTAGQGASTTLSELLGTGAYAGKRGAVPGANGLPYGYLTRPFAPTQATLNAYPGYQFALQTGGQAIRNADTPGVGALSGPALKDLMSFNVGTANQFYGQYFNQYQQQQNNIFNRLSSLAGIGQAAAGQQAAAGTQLGAGIAQAQAAAGGAQAGGVVGATNSLSGIPLSYLLANGANIGSFGNDFSPADLTQIAAGGQAYAAEGAV